jgi:hypothetical protein
LLPRKPSLPPLISCRPLYIEIEGGNPSPYLKELLSKVGNSQIEFMDFTLEDPVRLSLTQEDISEEERQAEEAVRGEERLDSK